MATYLLQSLYLGGLSNAQVIEPFAFMLQIDTHVLFVVVPYRIRVKGQNWILSQILLEILSY